MLSPADAHTGAAGPLLRNKWTLIALACALGLGVLLRLYMLSDQLVWDDEWHGINIAVLHPLKYIITHFHSDDNCIPLSIYFRVLLNSVELNETLIRIPSISSGILILVLCPFFASRMLRAKGIIPFAFLLATSPLLVYYSRYARPYSPAILLGFIAIGSFYVWVTERKNIYALTYVLAAILAPYFSLSALAFVLAPIPYSCLLSAYRHYHRPGKRALQEVKKIAALAVIVLAGICAWILPAASSMADLMQKGGRGYINFGTVAGCMMLFGGLRSYLLSGILILFFCYGIFLVFKTNGFLFGYLATAGLLEVLFVFSFHPFLAQSSWVTARYMSTLIPLWLFFIAVALSDLGKRIAPWQQSGPAIRCLLLLMVSLILFWKGPIPAAYGFQNDFTNHPDFQYEYFRSHTNIGQNLAMSCPNFYLELRDQQNIHAIIEFPGIVSWYYNPYHLYQKVHGQRVLLGYSSTQFGPFFGYNLPAHNTLHLQNAVDLSKPEEIRQSQAGLIVVHKNIYEEAAAVRSHIVRPQAKLSLSPDSLDSIQIELKSYVWQVRKRLERNLGSPILENQQIAVYRIPRNPKTDIYSKAFSK
jgi:hypothetical protein